MGPILIFDKSTLESLNPDEAALLDQFFLTNIVPVFFMETLADLEKNVRPGRTPEDVVGNLAYKTPDANSRPNVHHATLIQGELLGAGSIEMRGVPIISGGREVELDGKLGVVHEESPEEQAFQRWQRKEFGDFERSAAKVWRESLSKVDYGSNKDYFQTLFKKNGSPTTLQGAKDFAQSLVDGADQDRVLRWGFRLLGVSHEVRKRAESRWFSQPERLLTKFAPYFHYVLSVEVFISVAIAAGLIPEGEPSHTALDVAYLYYLPFCMVFTSSDKFHKNTAPLLLKPDQDFVWGPDLKSDLAKLDAHYSALPEEVLNRGLYSFASKPPADGKFLVSRLWDKHFKTWRERPELSPQPKSEAGDRLIDRIKRMHKLSKQSGATPTRPDHPEPDEVMFTRHVYKTKGKWKRFPPEVENSKPILE